MAFTTIWFYAFVRGDEDAQAIVALALLELARVRRDLAFLETQRRSFVADAGLGRMRRNPTAIHSSFGG